MKKSILVAAIGAAVVAAPTFAADKLVLSGEMDYVFVNINSGATGSSAYNEIKDGGKFVISGTEDLGNGLGGIFLAETGLDASYAAGKAYVGLNTPSAGKFIFGEEAPATDWLGKSFDKGTFFSSTSGQNAGHDGDQGIYWRSPNWSGFQVALNWTPNDSYTGTTGESAETDIGVGFKYAAKNWGIGLAYDKEEQSSTNSEDYETYTNFDAYYKISSYLIGLTYGQVKDNSGPSTYNSNDWAGLGFQGIWGPHELSVNYGQRWNYKVNGTKTDGAKGTNFAVDYAYALSSRTRIGGGFASVKDKNGGGNYAPENGTAPGTDDTSRALGVGVKHTF